MAQHSGSSGSGLRSGALSQPNEEEASTHGAQRAAIYGLYDPKDCEIRYVGKTSQSPKDRLDQHISKTKCEKNGYCGNWIRSVIKEGRRPQIIVLEVCSQEEWQERERLAIATLRANGHRLVNFLEGGAPDWTGRKHSDATKAKISAYRSGRLLSPEHRASIGNSLRGNKRRQGAPTSLETKRKLSTALKGKPKSATARENIRQGALRRWAK